MCCSFVSVCCRDIHLILERPACNMLFSSSSGTIATERFKMMYLFFPLMKALVHNTLKSWPMAATQFHRVCCKNSLFRGLNVPSTRAILQQRGSARNLFPNDTMQPSFMPRNMLSLLPIRLRPAPKRRQISLCHSRVRWYDL